MLFLQSFLSLYLEHIIFTINILFFLCLVRIIYCFSPRKNIEFN